MADVSFLMRDYFGVLVVVVFAFFAFALFYVLNVILRPRQALIPEFKTDYGTYEMKMEGSESHTAYECGEIPIGEADVQFNFQFYVFALAFVIFDVLSVMLFLLAPIATDGIIGETGIITIAGAALVLLVSFFYWARKGQLAWF